MTDMDCGTVCRIKEITFEEETTDMEVTNFLIKESYVLYIPWPLIYSN